MGTCNIFLILEELPNIGNRPNSVWEGAKGGTKGGEECDSADNFQLQLRRLGSPPIFAIFFAHNLPHDFCSKSVVMKNTIFGPEHHKYSDTIPIPYV